jgi:DNA-binding transcriptional regulator YiaG
MTIKEARIKAGLTQRAMTDLLLIPYRTVQDWESGKHNPPIYVEKLVIEKLLQIAEQSAKQS